MSEVLKRRLVFGTVGLFLLTMTCVGVGNVWPAVSTIKAAPRLFVVEDKAVAAVQASIVEPVSVTSSAVQSSIGVLPSTSQSTQEPYVELPSEIRGEVGSFVTIRAKTNGKNVWWLCDTANFHQFPSDLLKDSKAVVLIPRKTGKYPVYAWTALGDNSHPAVVCWVIVGDVPPGPGPGPNPGPNPVEPQDAWWPTLKGAWTAETAASKAKISKLIEIYRESANAVKTTQTSTVGDFFNKVHKPAVVEIMGQDLLAIRSAMAGCFDSVLPTTLTDPLDTETRNRIATSFLRMANLLEFLKGT